MAVGPLLKEWRRRGLSQLDFALKAEVDIEQLSKLARTHQREHLPQA